jgi:hypothetical protein
MMWSTYRDEGYCLVTICLARCLVRIPVFSDFIFSTFPNTVRHILAKDLHSQLCYGGPLEHQITCADVKRWWEELVIVSVTAFVTKESCSPSYVRILTDTPQDLCHGKVTINRVSRLHFKSTCQSLADLKYQSSLLTIVPLPITTHCRAPSRSPRKTATPVKRSDFKTFEITLGRFVTADCLNLAHDKGTRQIWPRSSNDWAETHMLLVNNSQSHEQAMVLWPILIIARCTEVDVIDT